VLAARKLLHGPFAVINADDYYGPEAFRVMYDYLSTHQDGQDGGKYAYCMVGYELKNTVTKNGSVSRGVCVTDAAEKLVSVTERTRIEQFEDGAIRFSEDGGESWTELPGNTRVSMGLWGFGASFVPEAETRFGAFLAENLPANPLKCEYFLPSIVSELIDEGKAEVQMLHSADKWYGVTYKEDKPEVVAAVARMTEQGIYPAAF
jgi:hypothetical protein